MGQRKLKSKELLKIGFPKGRLTGIALNLVQKHYKNESKEFKTNLLKNLLNDPQKFFDDEIFNELAKEIAAPKQEILSIPCEILTKPQEYVIYGENEIEPGALQQMNIAMRLPVTVKGALMADAHEGYGLPIGGVLATHDCVIPYAVGMDIGCRMCLSVYDLPLSFIDKNKAKLKELLVNNTRFGNSPKEVFSPIMDDKVLDRKEFREIPFLKKMFDKAVSQIGTSGSGNHFVEIGEVEITENEIDLKLEPGKYVGILSHSGSRNLGAEIAKYYSNLAARKCNLPHHARQLSWLDLNTQEGQEYWDAMNLAGDYSSANHHQIHYRLSKALGEDYLVMVENHHNFAWSEKLGDGRNVIVHRKGATPAKRGALGIIPGSMVSKAFIVRGKGDAVSINSASHGAGRLFSRSKALNTFTKKDLTEVLRKNDVELIGGGLDEVPMAYKDINRIMNYQKDLVEVLGTFKPKIVRMDG